MADCMKCLISGRVQGVFFRASARDQAQRHGITGYAKNLPDGRVEVLACGERDALERLRDWLGRGPAAAEVTARECRPVTVSPPADFRTL